MFGNLPLDYLFISCHICSKSFLELDILNHLISSDIFYRLLMRKLLPRRGRRLLMLPRRRVRMLRKQRLTQSRRARRGQSGIGLCRTATSQSGLAAPERYGQNHQYSQPFTKRTPSTKNYRKSGRAKNMDAVIHWLREDPVRKDLQYKQQGQKCESSHTLGKGKPSQRPFPVKQVPRACIQPDNLFRGCHPLQNHSSLRDSYIVLRRLSA